MRIPGRRFATMLLTLAISMASAPVHADNHVEFATFDNSSAVAANDFTVRTLHDGNPTLAQIVAASCKRMNGTRVFPDTVLSPAQPICGWPKDRLLGVEIEGQPADSQVTVAVEFKDDKDEIDKKTSHFTRNGVQINTSHRATKYVRNNSSSGGSYALINDEAETLVLTNIEVRINGDPVAIFNIGNYTHTGTLLSSTASVTLAPGASQTFVTTGAPANRAVSIRFDAALASDPTRKYPALRADIVPMVVPNLGSVALLVSAGLLLTLGGALYLRRRNTLLRA